MLDTIALKLKYPAFRVTNPELFTPYFNTRENFNYSDYRFGKHRFIKCQQNPTLSDKLQGLYKPRLTGYVRFEGEKQTYELHIEFSIPKLLFGQNLQELENGDLDRVINILQTRLESMAIEVSKDTLRRATVVKVHFGKNISLLIPLTVEQAIGELYKADIGKTKDVNIRHYQNGGQSLYLYASSAHIIFYDKLREIITPKNRAVDKDKIKTEKLMLKGVDKDKQPEILRFEVRFAKQQSLNAFLSGVLGKKVNEITLERIFDKELCKKVLLVTWNKITMRPMSQIAMKTERPVGEVFDAMVRSLGSGGFPEISGQQRVEN